MQGWLRAALCGACEWLWSCSFALAGAIQRSRAARWSPVGNARVLVVAPHPDDECAGCGGTLVLHRRAGDQVMVLHVTDGRGSQRSETDPDTRAQTRACEVRAAAAALDVCAESLALPEYAWNETALCAELRARLARFKPHLVYAPSCVDFHPEHVRVARALAAALDDTTSVIRIYEVSVPLGAALANVVVDTSAAAPTHDAAITVYRSQRLALLPIKRLRRYWARFFQMTTSAEVFWEMSGSAYRALMQRGDWLGARAWTPSLPPFRSLRTRPFTDPLAFMQGRAQRRTLKGIVEAVR